MAIYKRTPKSNAQVRLENLKSFQEQKISLYNEKPQIQQESLSDKVYEINKQKKILFEHQQKCLEEAQKVLVSNAIFHSIVNPVLEEFGATTSEKTIGANIVNNFVQEHDISSLLNDWKHKSIYLAELANTIENHLDKYKNNIKDIKLEDLKDEDLELDGFDINDLISDTNGIIPKDITNLIYDRIEDSVDQFIDNTKKNKYEIKKIYDKTKEKIDSLNNSDDKEMIQNEAISFAKRKEKEILEQSTNVFGYMVNNIFKAIHENQTLKESYYNDYKSIDFNRIVNETKVLYSVLEAFNTLNIEPVSEEYLYKVLKEIK